MEEAADHLLPLDVIDPEGGDVVEHDRLLPGIDLIAWIEERDVPHPRARLPGLVDAPHHAVSADVPISVGVLLDECTGSLPRGAFILCVFYHLRLAAGAVVLS